MIKIGDKTGYAYMIHVSSDSNMFEGKKVNKGDLIGQVSDNDSGHFKEYGSHIHVYRSPSWDSKKFDPPFLMEMVDQSPEPIQMTEKILSLINKLLTNCLTILKTAK